MIESMQERVSMGSRPWLGFSLDMEIGNALADIVGHPMTPDVRRQVIFTIREAVLRSCASGYANSEYINFDVELDTDDRQVHIVSKNIYTACMFLGCQPPPVRDRAEAESMEHYENDFAVFDKLYDKVVFEMKPPKAGMVQ